MGKLFKIEMKKLWKSTAMRVMLIVVAGLSLFSVAIYTVINHQSSGFLGVSLEFGGYDMLRSLIKDSSDSMLFTVILVAILIGGDFSARTLQTQISAGFSRSKIVMSRYLSTLIAFVIFHMAYMILIVGGISLTSGFGAKLTDSEFANIVLQMFMGLFMSAATLSIYMFFCFLLKSTGASIGICLPFMLIGTSIIQMLSLWFEACETVISLTPFGQIMLVDSDLNATGYVKFFAVGVVWIVGMLGVTIVSFRRAELK